MLDLFSFMSLRSACCAGGALIILMNIFYRDKHLSIAGYRVNLLAANPWGETGLPGVVSKLHTSRFPVKAHDENVIGAPCCLRPTLGMVFL